MSSLTISPLPRGRVISTVSYGMPGDTVVSTKPSVSPTSPKKVRLRNFFTKLLMGILVVVIGASGALQAGATQNADANFLTKFLERAFCGEEAYWYAPSSPTAGLAALGIGEPIVYKNGVDPSSVANKTAYEKYGVSGTNFTLYRGTEVGMEKTSTMRGVDRDAAISAIKSNEEDPRAQAECIPVMGYISTSIANMLFNFNGLVTSVSIWVYGAAFNPTWISDLNDQVALVITGPPGQDSGLKDVLYFPFLIIIIMFAALYLGWIGLAKRASMQAATSALWMIGAVLTGSLLMFNPTFVPTMANGIVGAVEHAILQGTTGVALGVTNSENGETDAELMCSVTMNNNNTGTTPNNQAAVSAAEQSALDSQRIQVIRQMECSLWSTFIYMPWVSGQYGMSVTDVKDLASDSNEFNVPIGDRVISGNIALYQLDQQSAEYGGGNNAQEKMTNWFKVPDYLAENHSDMFETWAGKEDSGTLIGVAFLTWIVSIFGLASIVVLSISMLIYSLGMTMLIFVSVLFLLVGAHPGMGRGIALRWAEMVVGTILKRIMAAAILGILMAFYAIIIKNVIGDGDSSMGYGMSLLAIIAISIAALGYRKTLTEAFSNVQFGGTQSGMESGPSSGIKRLGSATGMAALTGVAAVGSGKAIKAGMAASRRPGGNALKGLGAAAKSTAKAAGAGGKRGAISGQMTGYAALDAYRSGSAAAEGEITKHEQAAGEAWGEKAPHEMEKRAREEKERTEAYREEYEKNIDNEQWRKNFSEYYGMEPPNPESHDFSGYGMTRDARTGRFKKNPKLLVKTRRKSQLPPPPPPPAPAPPPPPPNPDPEDDGPGDGGPGGGATVVDFNDARRRRQNRNTNTDTRPNPSQGQKTPSPEEPTSETGTQNEAQPTAGSSRPNPNQKSSPDSGNAQNEQPEQTNRKKPRSKPNPSPIQSEYRRKFDEYNQKLEKLSKMDMGEDNTAKRRMWENATKAVEAEHTELKNLHQQAQAEESKQYRGE